MILPVQPSVFECQAWTGCMKPLVAEIKDPRSIFSVIMQKVVFYRILVDNFHKFNIISAFILPQSETISAPNDRVVATFCMSDQPCVDFWLSNFCKIYQLHLTLNFDLIKCNLFISVTLTFSLNFFLPKEGFLTIRILSS